jgi:hypothetical protein
MRVLRYEFTVDSDVVRVRMPSLAQLLYVKPVRLDQIEVWALVEESMPEVNRYLRLAGTGHTIRPADTGRYVGTTVSHDSPARFVLHIFDLGEVEGES